MTGPRTLTLFDVISQLASAKFAVPRVDQINVHDVMAKVWVTGLIVSYQLTKCSNDIIIGRLCRDERFQDLCGDGRCSTEGR